MTLSESQPGRPPYRERWSFSTRTGVPPLAQTTFPACRAHYPGGPEPVRVSVTSRSVRPSPFLGRVGVRISTFEACLGFTRVTACKVAQPPVVALVTRLRPGPLPDQAACQLPDLPTTIWVGLPPTGDLRRWGAPRNLALNEPMKSMRDSSSPAAPRNDRLDGFSAARRTAALQRQFPHALKSERRFIPSSGRMEDW